MCRKDYNYLLARSEKVKKKKRLEISLISNCSINAMQRWWKRFELNMLRVCNKARFRLAPFIRNIAVFVSIHENIKSTCKIIAEKNNQNLIAVDSPLTKTVEKREEGYCWANLKHYVTNFPLDYFYVLSAHFSCRRRLLSLIFYSKKLMIYSVIQTILLPIAERGLESPLSTVDVPSSYWTSKSQHSTVSFVVRFLMTKLIFFIFLVRSHSKEKNKMCLV